MSAELSLRNRLLRFLVSNRYWHSSGELQKLTMLHANQTGRTCVRRLQEMYEEGLLERELRKGHCWYKAKEGVEAPKEHDPNHIQGTGRLRSYEELIKQGMLG